MSRTLDRRAFLSVCAGASFSCGGANVAPPSESQLVTLAPAPEPPVVVAKPTPPGRKKIAALFPLTGERGERGRRGKLAVEVALEVLGEGHGLDFEFIDTELVKNDSPLASDSVALKRLFDRSPATLGIFGELNSSHSRAIAAVANLAQIPMLTPSSTENGISETGPYAFRSCFIDEAQGRGAAKFLATELRLKKVGILRAPEQTMSSALANSFRLEAELHHLRTYGLTLVPKTFEFKGAIAAMKQNGCEAIFAPIALEPMHALIAAARADRFDLDRIIGTDALSDAELWRAFDGGYFIDHFAPDAPDPGTRRFVEAFDARDPNGSDSLVASVYDGVLVLADAVARMAEPTRNALRDALATTRDVLGSTGPLGIDRDRNGEKPLVVKQIRGGYPVWRATISTGNPTPVAPRG